MKRINVILPEITLQRIMQEASIRGITKAALIREWIDKYNEPFLVLAPITKDSKLQSFSLRLDDHRAMKLEALANGYKSNVYTVLRSILDRNIYHHYQAKYFVDYQSFVERLAREKDINSLLQAAANLLQDKLNLQGVVFFKIENDRLYSKVHSNSWFISRLLRVLGRKIDEYFVVISEHRNNILVKSILDRKDYYTSNYREINIHAMNETLAQVTMRLIRFKCGLIFPISYNGKLQGTSLFYKNKVEDFEKEKPLITAVAGYLALRMEQMGE